MKHKLSSLLPALFLPLAVGAGALSGHFHQGVPVLSQVLPGQDGGLFADGLPLCLVHHHCATTAPMVAMRLDSTNRS